MKKTQRLITITASMNDAHGIRKLGGDKIALLGLFVVALLTARLVVALKSALLLTEPIQLHHTGLSASMPAGNGWRSEKQWKYRENVFTLTSSFALGSGEPTAWAQCRYLLAAETTTPEMRFEQEASEVDGAIVETDQTRTDTLTIDWAHIENPKILLSMFLGNTKLPDNRQLDIEVYQIATSDPELAEQAFKRIVKSLNFEDSQLLKTGAEIIAQVKRKGLDSYLDNQNQQAFFLIKDSARRTIGFTMNVLIDSGRDDYLNIRAAGSFYIRGGQEQGTSFQSSNTLDEFLYKSETHGRTGRSGAEIVTDGAGIMTVRKFGPQPEEKNYGLSPAAIPDIFLDQLFRQMLENNTQEVVVDVIQADGKIIPTHVSGIQVTKDIAADEDAAYVFKLEFLDGRGFSERVYLNAQEQIYKRLVQQRSIYIFESTSVKNIVREFPERAEDILQKNRMLND
ncbi:MAG: hypothetical protein PVJ86_00630 [Phycisphaerales bacterium]